MTSAPSHAPERESALAAVYRHIATAHQRLATAYPLDADVAADCLEDLYEAMDLLEDAEPSLRSKVTDGSR